MRDFVRARVPVRMGVGKGTYHEFTFAVELSGPRMVTKALFAGTGIVRAHAAEQCGAKGMRIFVHPSLEDDLTAIGTRVLPLPTGTTKARWELDYLHTKHPIDRVPPEKLNQQLRDSVRQMEDEAPDHARVQYSETLSAMDRMQRRTQR